MKYKNKRAEMLQQVLVHVILVALVFSVFFVAVVGRVDSRGVKQQVLEKQLALLIDSAGEGMIFSIWKENLDGAIEDVRIIGGKIYVDMDGFKSTDGYPFFSLYNIRVYDDNDKFYLEVSE